MLTIFFRAILLYLIMLVTLRGMGKHQLGQYQPYEFAMAIVMADLISAPISDVSTPLLQGILPVAALFVIHSALTLVCMISDRARAIISGKPVVVINNGKINRQELTRLCLSLSDLLEGLRTAGVLDPREVGTAVIEATGSISAFPKAAFRPVNTAEMQKNAPYEGFPLTLIMDGRVQSNNLKMSGQGESWLAEMLGNYNLRTGDVLLCSLDTQGGMHVQDNRGTVLEWTALKPEEVAW